MPIFELFLIAACLYAAVTDFLYYKIPNWIVIALIGVYLIKAAVAIAMGAPLTDFIIPATSFGIILCVGFILFAVKILGAGDAKLLAACALWMGEINIMQFIVLTLIAGGLIAIIYLKLNQGVDFLRNLVLAKIITKLGKASAPPTDKKSVPYAIAIFIGVVWVLRING